MASGHLVNEVALGSIPSTWHSFWKSTLIDSELEASLSYIHGTLAEASTGQPLGQDSVLRSCSLRTGKPRQARCQVFLTSSGTRTVRHQLDIHTPHTHFHLPSEPEPLCGHSQVAGDSAVHCPVRQAPPSPAYCPERPTAGPTDLSFPRKPVETRAPLSPLSGVMVTQEWLAPVPRATWPVDAGACEVTSLHWESRAGQEGGSQ